MDVRPGILGGFQDYTQKAEDKKNKKQVNP